MTSASDAWAISDNISRGLSYLICTPSKLRTASPPSLLISIAKLTSVTASIAEAIIGMEKVKPSILKSMFVWSGLIVISPGTIATSSNP
ncbi:hypothetical protein ES703_122551 [subsurface metagenome]